MSSTSFDSRHSPGPSGRWEDSLPGLVLAGGGFYFGAISVLTSLAGQPSKQTAVIVGGLAFVVCLGIFAFGPAICRAPLLIAMLVVLGCVIHRVEHKTSSAVRHASHSIVHVVKAWVNLPPIDVGTGAQLLAVSGGNVLVFVADRVVDEHNADEQPKIVFKTRANPSALAAGNGVVAAVLNGHVVVWRVGRPADRQTARLSTGAGPILIANGFVFAPDRATSKVYALPISNPQNDSNEMSVPGPVNGFAQAGRSVWASTKATTVDGVHEPGYIGRLILHSEVERRQLPAGGRLLAYSDRTLWISVGTPGHDVRLVRWNLSEGQVKPSVRLHSSVVGLAYTRHVVYVLLRDRRLLAIDPSTDHIMGSVTVQLPDVSGIATTNGKVLIISRASSTMIEPEYLSIRESGRSGTRRAESDRPRPT
jgi:hypothetical protein